jgi:tetratricopeptide (TPR) repeat protein
MVKLELKRKMLLKRLKIGISLFFFFFAFTLNAQDRLKNLFSLGIEYYKKGDYADALFNYEQALKLYPDSYEILNNIGLCYQKLSDFDNAEKFYQKSLNDLED